MAITPNRNGKVALTLWCGEDGRHLRAFCNHRQTVEEVVARLEAQATALPAITAGGEPPTPADPALQKTSEGPARAKAARKEAATGGMSHPMLLLAAAIIVLTFLMWPRGAWRWR